MNNNTDPAEIYASGLVYGTTLSMTLTTLLGRYGIAEVCDRLGSIAHEASEQESELEKHWTKLSACFDHCTDAATELESAAQRYTFFETGHN